MCLYTWIDVENKLNVLVWPTILSFSANVQYSICQHIRLSHRIDDIQEYEKLWYKRKNCGTMAKTMLIYRKLWKFDKKGGGGTWLITKNYETSKWKKIYGYLTISFLNTKNVNNGEFLNKYSVLKLLFVKKYGTMNKPMIVYLKLLTFVFLWKQLCY